jgi:hypothetical protein
MCSFLHNFIQNFKLLTLTYYNYVVPDVLFGELINKMSLVRNRSKNDGGVGYAYLISF